jgi:archaellin
MLKINKQLSDAIKIDNTALKTEFRFPTDKITRLEVIEANNGRAYVNMNATNIEFSLQDDGRTLKIFVK